MAAGKPLRKTGPRKTARENRSGENRSGKPLSLNCAIFWCRKTGQPELRDFLVGKPTFAVAGYPIPESGTAPPFLITRE
jgi:hypothetical protein